MQTDLRRWIRLCETDHAYRLYHGSNHADIKAFRLDIHNRTGTPGTLSFTTSLKTAQIYGRYIYEAEVRGNFGDYLNSEDIDNNLAWRWPERKASLIPRFADKVAWNERFNKPKQSLDEWLAEVAEKDRQQIADGHYAQWENVGLWQAMGWDGAWCIESGSRNLIIGNIACVQMIGKLQS